MKYSHFVFSAIALLSLLACQRAPKPSEDPEEEGKKEEEIIEDPENDERKLVAPGELTLSASADAITLSWKDNSNKEEGYEVMCERKSDKKTTSSFIKANSTSWEGPLPGSGNFIYTVRAYYRTDRGEGASVEYSCNADAKIALSAVQHSHWAMAATVTLTDDGGEACEVGLCWGENNNPTVEDNCTSCAKRFTSGKSFEGLVEWLEPAKTYYLRAWAKNANGIFYSGSEKVTTDQSPTALNPSGTQLTSYGLPESVKLYSSVSDITGSKVNMWWAIADMSSGDIELRTTIASSLTTPTNHVKGTLSKDGEVYICVNGGYFGSPNTSYSLVVDRGTKKAKNIASLTRTESYSVTRGAFGIDRSGQLRTCWTFESGSNMFTYNRALPVVDGNTALSAGAKSPEESTAWDVYSAIGGAPVLIKDGTICFDFMETAEGKYFTNHELLQADIFKKGLKAPRTAVGSTADGKIVIFVCDGRNSGGSAGLTLDELARIMKGLGCTNALNLDGGGSSMMVATSKGTLLNNPSDGQQRSVLSFLSIISK